MRWILLQPPQPYGMTNHHIQGNVIVEANIRVGLKEGHQ